jgi:hypothetical protein
MSNTQSTNSLKELNAKLYEMGENAEILKLRRLPRLRLRT